MSPSAPAPALSLAIPPYIYCAGSYVEGEVLLDFRQLQKETIEEVHIKLRGTSQTIVELNRTTYIETHALAYADLSLWTKGAQYPPPGSDVLRLPFRFLLPPDLPPSFHYRGLQKSASVLYSLTAVGVRPGTFQINKRLRTPLIVLQNDGLGARLRSMAGLSLVGWRRGHREERIRKGLWGEYATVSVELSLPDIPVLPLFTDIPYIIKVVTTTAPLARSKADAHPLNKPIFPPPPASPSELHLRLYRTLNIKARHLSVSSETDVAWILGDRASSHRVQADIELPEKEWVIIQSGDEKGRGTAEEKGKWVQRATIQGKMRLSVPPSFATDTMKCEYVLWLKVPFAGLGNDVVIRVPVHVNSGIDAPIPRELPQSQSRPVQNSASQQQQGQTLDLPPAYWDVGDHHWRNMDEKE